MALSSHNKTLTIIDKKDLPVSCPQAGAPLWKAHPKVFIPLHETPSYQCPYCGTLFVLKKEKQ
ncbi:MAG TPA: zinc-finger domain-containing protein [Gammaproteobacteria bacterium]|nr:zinc-finger domain-containing protein [Gammaproteobacteria bacterium]